MTVRNPLDFLDVNLVNAGESEIFGLELDADWRPNASWIVNGSVGLLSAEFTDFTSADQNFTGNDLPFAPALSAALGVTYNINDKWSVGADATFTDSYFSTPGNTIEIASRTLFNAQVNWRGDNSWSGGAYIRNIADEDYITQAFAIPGDTTVQVGEGRTIGAFLQVEF